MRAVVRGDLDGIVSATLLKAIELVDAVEMVAIKDILDGKFVVTDQDIVCNLPYEPEACMWFDHHSSEAQPEPPLPADFRGSLAMAPSTAGVVYNYFLSSHPEIERFQDLVADTDTFDSAALTPEQVQNPTGNILLGFLLDPRTRLGGSDPERRKAYLQWKQGLPDLLLTRTTEEILALPETRKWHEHYQASQAAGEEVLRECTHLDGNVIVSDFRGRRLPPMNRFVLYTLPEFAAGNVSVQISDGDSGRYHEIAVGHSIFNRTCTVDVGDLCAWYGGGGHKTVAVCRPGVEDSEEVFQEIIAACRERPAGNP